MKPGLWLLPLSGKKHKAGQPDRRGRPPGRPHTSTRGKRGKGRGNPPVTEI